MEVITENCSECAGVKINYILLTFHSSCTNTVSLSCTNTVSISCTNTVSTSLMLSK